MPKIYQSARENAKDNHGAGNGKINNKEGKEGIHLRSANTTWPSYGGQEN